jgi:DNA invertase Pin-like site-specific DNA recombinase
MRAALYVRVSTIGRGQLTANQTGDLQRLCDNQNWFVVAVYEDHDSGSTSERIEFQGMLRDAATGKFDILVFWALDRFTREGTLATLKYLELLESYGVRWRSLMEPWIDSAGPFRDVIVSLLASLAHQERVRLSERIRAGMDRAKTGGTRSGKPIGRPRAVFRRDEAQALRKVGLSWGQIAKKIGVSKSSARRACLRPSP